MVVVVVDLVEAVETTFEVVETGLIGGTQNIQTAMKKNYL